MSTLGRIEPFGTARALLPAESLWKEAERIAHLGSWSWDLASGQELWSDEQFRIFGYEPDGRVASYELFVTALHPDDRDRVLAAVEAALRGQEDYDVECRIVRPDGGIREVRCRGDVERDDQGEPLRMVGTVLDITEAAAISRALKLAEQRWKFALEGGQDAVWDWNLPAGQMYLSPRLLANLGFAPDELPHLPTTLQERVHPDDLARVFAEFDACLSGSVPHLASEHRLSAKDGGYRWVLARGMVVARDIEGAPLRMVGTHTDVTARKETEIALQLSEERFRSAFDYSAIGIALVGLDGRWLRVNHRVCDIVGYSEAELLASSFQAITHPDDLARDLGQVARMLAGEICHYHVEKRYMHRLGHAVWIRLAVSLVRTTDGVPRHFVSQIEDITERKLAEASLRESLHEKEVLLQEVHHRVKNNLQVISSLLRMQAEQIHDVRSRAAIDDIQSRIHSIALLHEHLYRSTDLSMVDVGTYLADLVRAVMAAQTDHGIEASVRADALLVPLEQAVPLGLVVNELVTNATKHAFPATSPRCRTISVELEVDPQIVRIVIRDNGVGMPPAFDPRDATTVGLRLVGSLARQLRGEVSFACEGGTLCTLAIPRQSLSRQELA